MPPERPKSKIDHQIDENLKRVYDEALKEDVPEKFLELIARLKAKERGTDDDRSA